MMRSERLAMVLLAGGPLAAGTVVATMPIPAPWLVRAVGVFVAALAAHRIGVLAERLEADR